MLRGEPLKNDDVDRAIQFILVGMLSSEDFMSLLSNACDQVWGKSTPHLRTQLKEEFMRKVGLCL
jgi:hypothetical protein